MLGYWPTRRDIRGVGQGPIGARPATPRIDPIGSCRVQLSGHLSGKDAVGPIIASFGRDLAGCRSRFYGSDCLMAEAIIAFTAFLKSARLISLFRHDTIRQGLCGGDVSTWPDGGDACDHHRSLRPGHPHENLADLLTEIQTALRAPLSPEEWTQRRDAIMGSVITGPVAGVPSKVGRGPFARYSGEDGTKLRIPGWRLTKINARPPCHLPHSRMEHAEILRRRIVAYRWHLSEGTDAELAQHFLLELIRAEAELAEIEKGVEGAGRDRRSKDTGVVLAAPIPYAIGKHGERRDENRGDHQEIPGG